MSHIEAFLQQNACHYPEHAAIVCGDRAITYADLYEASVRESQTMMDTGFRRGSLVPIRAVPTIEYLVCYFAIHMAGGVVVPLAKDLSDDEFAAYECRLRGVTVPDNTADILFTTGTTGKSKGVIISHDAIIADADNLIQRLGFRHDVAFIVSGPLNHCGCWSKIFPCIMQGSTIILTDGFRDVNDFFLAIDRQPSKVATFLVPSSIRILLQFGADRLADHATNIDFLETGGAPLMQSEMARLCDLLPASRLYNTYASTETGIVASYDYNTSERVYGCVGLPMKHSAIEISSEGQIVCGGATLMTGYLGDTDLTASILHDGRLTMSDRGHIDQEGRLHLLGRNDDTINTGAYKVEPTEVEEVAMQIPHIVDCLCIAMPHPILGQALKLLYITDDGQPLVKRDMALHIKSCLETYKVPLGYELVESIRTTFNGKKDRKSYR